MMSQFELSMTDGAANFSKIDTGLAALLPPLPASLNPVIVSNKSSTAFKTISEAAALLSVPQHVLRFWESKFSQIRPLKMKGGRRYYRQEDIVHLQRIKDLLYAQGYTIKGAKKALAEQKKLPVMTSDLSTLFPLETVEKPAKPKKEKSVKPRGSDKEELIALRDKLLGLRDILRERLN